MLVDRPTWCRSRPHSLQLRLFETKLGFFVFCNGYYDYDDDDDGDDDYYDDDEDDEVLSRLSSRPTFGSGCAPHRSPLTPRWHREQKRLTSQTSSQLAIQDEAAVEIGKLEPLRAGQTHI